MKELVLLLPLAMAVSACSLVLSERTVGGKAAPAAKFGGTWQAADEDRGILELIVRDGPGGILRTKDGDDETEFELREHHGWVFANRVVAEDGASGFAWYRVEMAPDGDRFRLWTPDPDAFGELVNAGTLQGRVIDRGQPQPPQPAAPGNQPAANRGASGTLVVISEKDDRWIRKMMEGRFGDVFDAESPVTYVRIPPEEARKNED